MPVLLLLMALAILPLAPLALVVAWETSQERAAARARSLCVCPCIELSDLGVTLSPGEGRAVHHIPWREVDELRLVRSREFLELVVRLPTGRWARQALTRADLERGVLVQASAANRWLVGTRAIEAGARAAGGKGLDSRSIESPCTLSDYLVGQRLGRTGRSWAGSPAAGRYGRVGALTTE